MAAPARTVRLTNDLDAATAPLLRRRLAPLSEAAGDVVVDLSGVTHLDTAGADGRWLLERRGEPPGAGPPGADRRRMLTVVHLP